MRKLFLSAVCLCIFLCIVHAQSKKDSLLRSLNASPSDTARILTLNEFSDIIRRSNPDTALLCVNEALQLAEKINYKKGVAACLNSKGNILNVKNDLEGAQQSHQQALKLSQEIHNAEEEARAYTGFGQIAQLKGEYHLMNENFLKALQINLQTGNKKAIATSYTNVAASFGTMVKYDSCLFYQLQGVKILESINEHQGLGKAYSTIGAVFLNMKNFSEALKYLKAALENSHSAGDNQQQAHVLNLMGQANLELKKYDEAVRCYKESIQLAEELGRKIYVGRGFMGLGDIADGKGDYQEAIINYQYAYSITKELQSPPDLIMLGLKMGEVLNKTGKHAEALRYLENILTVASFNESPDDRMNVFSALYTTYSLLNDYKKAYYYLELYTIIKDSVTGKEQAQMVEDLKLQYETGKKDQQISLLNLQNENKERQKRLLILVSVLLAVSLITLFFVFRQRIQISKLKEAERSRQQLQILRNDIAHDLHDDIGSTLSSISYYSEAIRQQAKETTPGVIPLLDKMEKASGNTIDAMSDIVWAINATHDIGANLLNRMQVYATEMCGIKNINLEFNADKSFETAKLSMDVRKNLYLIFKEAVNNAIKYSGCQRVKISLEEHNDHIILKVNDDGNGFDTGKEFAGNGLKNMYQRAVEIKASLSLISEKGKGTSVILSR